MKIGNGSASAAVSQDIVEGSSVQIHAIAESGASFQRWFDGNTNATRTVTVNEDMELQAIFVEDEPEEDPEPGTEPGGDEEDMVTLTLECSESCIPAPTGAGQFQKGTSVSFSARQKYSEPAGGDMYDVYTFSQWSDGSTERERTMVLNSDTTLTAMYTYSQGYGDE